MTAYLDTSALIAALVEDHPQHAAALGLLRSARAGSLPACTSAHTLAELHSVLTRTPFTPRVYPAEARQLIEQTVLPLVALVELTGEEYRQVISESAAGGWTGGLVHDVIHVHAARKAACDRLYTLNVRDFRRIAPDLRDRITAP